MIGLPRGIIKHNESISPAETSSIASTITYGIGGAFFFSFFSGHVFITRSKYFHLFLIQAIVWFICNQNIPLRTSVILRLSAILRASWVVLYCGLMFMMDSIRYTRSSTDWDSLQICHCSLVQELQSTRSYKLAENLRVYAAHINMWLIQVILLTRRCHPQSPTWKNENYSTAAPTAKGI